jgi:predicted PurR-regulated permease PerM
MFTTVIITILTVALSTISIEILIRYGVQIVAWLKTSQNEVFEWTDAEWNYIVRTIKAEKAKLTNGESDITKWTNKEIKEAIAFILAEKAKIHTSLMAAGANVEAEALKVTGAIESEAKTIVEDVKKAL